MESGKVKVVQAEVAEIMVDEVVDPAVELAGIRREGLRLKGVTIPFVGETPTGGERTKFLPCSSKDFFKPYPVNLHPVNLYPVNFNPVRLLPVDWNDHYKGK